jgi:hypothetical protein
MKYVLSLFISFLIPLSANAAARPYWSVEMRGGVTEPALPNWSTYYQDKRPITGFVDLSFKPLRFFELGLETGYLRAQGKGLLPLNGTTGGEVTHELLPITALATLRLTFTDRQWVVPYVGGGWNRVTYRQSIKGQDTVMGAAQGFVYRGGIQILLDPFDNLAANYLRDDYGISNTFVVIEYRKNEAIVNAIDLGGSTYTTGIMLEF